MQRGVVVRCFISGALATLIFIQAHPVFAASFTDISENVVPNTGSCLGDGGDFCASLLIASSTNWNAFHHAVAVKYDPAKTVDEQVNEYLAGTRIPTLVYLTNGELTGSRIEVRAFADAPDGCETLEGPGAQGNLLITFGTYGCENGGSFLLFADASGPPYTVSDSVEYFILHPNYDTHTFYVVSPSTTAKPCVSDCNDNVLFLPGMGGSRLYRPARPDEQATEHKLWEPLSDNDAAYLHLDANGKEPDTNTLSPQVYTRDVFDEAYASLIGPNIYKSFITKMDSLKASGKINDWAAVPYDWRLSLEDILSSGNKNGEKISYLSPSPDPYIIHELVRLATTSRSGKVTIVAHSNGGLLTKALLIANPELVQYVNRIIFVDVPQVGTPQAIASLLHGQGQGIPADQFPLFLSPVGVRSFAQNAPVVYNLLPSAKYFTSIADPVTSFDLKTTPDWVAKYGVEVKSRNGLSAFVSDSYQRVSADDANTAVPTSANTLLLAQAQTTHDLLDSWTPPPSVEVIQIAGWGIPTTIKGLEYARTSEGLTVTASTTIDGDGTVVTPSQLWTSAGLPNVKNYWVDLDSYNSPLNRALKGNLLLPIDHKSILEVDGLLSFISDSTTRMVRPLPEYIFLFATRPQSNSLRLRYTLHSPLTLDLYDNFGNHTGIASSTGQIEEQIPGTYYMEVAGVKYLFTDASSTSHIVMRGYATSTFTFSVEQLQGDNLTASTTFKDIPVTPRTTAKIDVISDIETLSSMRINLGDGIDRTLVPLKNGTVGLDMTPPEIRIGFSTSTNTLTFTASDDSGNATILESTSLPSLKKNQSGLATTMLTSSDPSGNTTSLVFTSKYPPKDRRISITPLSVSYNGVVTPLSSTTLKYKWSLAPNVSYKMFATFVQTGTTSTEGHWRPKKNITILMQKPADFDDSDADDDADSRPIKVKLPGIVVPNIMTQKGKISLVY